MTIFGKKCAYCGSKAEWKYRNSFGSHTWVCAKHYREMKHYR